MTYSFLTCLPQRERNMFDLIYLAFHQAIPQDLTDDRILVLTRAIHHLTHEAHQLKGFLRFCRLRRRSGGADHPQNRVLPLLRPHFCQRLAGGGLPDPRQNPQGGPPPPPPKGRPPPPPPPTPTPPPRGAERQCQALWRRFYHTVAIPAGKTPSCAGATCPSGFGRI